MRANRTRSGAALVETALVLSTALLFLFGIFEYARYLVTLQVCENAAREGARFAVAHTADMAEQDIKDWVAQKLAGVEGSVANLTVTVSAQILQPDVAGEAKGDALPDWTSASSNDGIQVAVEGDFQSVLPSFLSMGATIRIQARSLMYSEGN